MKGRTGHGLLLWLCNFKNPEGQLARWMKTLGSYDIKLEYRPSRSHQNADGTSRITNKTGVQGISSQTHVKYIHLPKELVLVLKCTKKGRNVCV